jgi:4-amino-4-deoxy-L-arabinose transferase-like glycosyltransferase
MHAALAAVLVAVALVSLTVRVRLLDVPLDRDEGEYAYIGQLLLKGIPPYAGAYNMKMPGIYALYALILACFGQTPAGVRAGLLVTTFVTAALVFILGWRIAGILTAVCAATFFLTLTLNPKVLGLAGYAEHYVLPFAVAGALTLLIAEARAQARLLTFALSGVLFGLAAIVKQSGAAFILFAIAYIGFTAPSLPMFTARVSALIGGVAIPTAVVVVALGMAGAFPRFWFWTVQYAVQYVTQPTLAEGLRHFTGTGAELTKGSWPVLALAVCGLIYLSRVALGGRDRSTDLRSSADAGDASRFPRRSIPTGHRTAAMLTFMLVTAFLGASAGLYFREHYFLLLSPVVALLAAVGVDRLVWRAAAMRVAAAAIVAGVCLIFPAAFLFAYEAAILFVKSPTEVSRTLYGRNPFIEAVEVARYIRDRAGSDERIAVIGSEPEIYFYARRPAATGYIYMYPLMEPQPYAARMQAEMIHQIELSRPSYLVFVRSPASWLLKPTSDQTILRWLERYSTNFHRVGVADIVSRELTHYRWDADARDYVPKSPYWLGVYRRNAD